MSKKVPAAEAPPSSDRRSFVRRAGLTALGAAAAAPVVGASTAQAGTTVAYTDDPNTFTAPQTITNSGAPPLTLKGDSPSYPLQLRDIGSNNVVARLGNIEPSGSVAGVLVLHGTNGLGTYGAAWQVGVDVANSPKTRDFFIAKVNSDDSVRDVMFIWNNGATGNPAVDFFPAGPSYVPNASVTINGQNNSQVDPPLLNLRANARMDADVMTVKVITESQPRFSIDKNGYQKWGSGGSTAPGGLRGAPGITLDNSSGNGLMISQGGASAGVSRTLVLNNSRTTRSQGDGSRLTFMLDGFTMARIDATYWTDPAGTLGLQVATGSGTFVERVSMTRHGIAFNGNKPFLVPTYGSATAGGNYGSNEQQMLQRVYTLVRNLGFFT